MKCPNCDHEMEPAIYFLAPLKLCPNCMTAMGLGSHFAALYFNGRFFVYSRTWTFPKAYFEYLKESPILLVSLLLLYVVFVILLLQR